MYKLQCEGSHPAKIWRGRPVTVADLLGLFSDSVAHCGMQSGFPPDGVLLNKSALQVMRSSWPEALEGHTDVLMLYC